MVLEGVGGGLRQREQDGDGVGVGEDGEEDAVNLAGEGAHVRRPPLAEVDVLQPQPRPRRDDQRRRQVRLGAAPLVEEVHGGSHVVVVDALLGLLHQPHPGPHRRQLGRRGLGAGQHEGVAAVGPGELWLEAAPHVDGEEELDTHVGRRGEGEDPGAPHVRRQRLEGGAAAERPGLEAPEVGRREGQGDGGQRRHQLAGRLDAAAAAVLRVREGDARRAARAQGAAVMEDDGEVVVTIGGGGEGGPGVEEVGGGDAVADAVADGRTHYHASAPQLCHLHYIANMHI